LSHYLFFGAVEFGNLLPDGLWWLYATEVISTCAYAIPLLYGTRLLREER